MARKVSATFLDDIDLHVDNGEEENPAAETVTISYSAGTWELDLSDGHLKDLEQDWTRFGRKVTGSAAVRTTRVPRKPVVRKSVIASGREQNQAVRDWATSQGIDVAPRGRIPSAVVEQYENAHKAPTGRKGK